MKRLIYIAIFSLLLFSCKEDIQHAEKIDSYPEIYPDYIGVTIPMNIAPLNFTVDSSDYSSLELKILAGNEVAFQEEYKNNIDIPQSAWQDLLAKNCSDSIQFEVSVKKADQWFQYKPFSMYVSPDSIDYGIVYRLISPGYETYSKMGIYERELSGYNQRPLFENTQVTKSCVNCHTFNRGNPQQQSIHIRGAQGATIIKTNGETKILESANDSILASCMYPFWHPSGKYIAYSTNKVRQTFHTTATDLIETFDEASDLLVYDIENNTLLTSDLISGSSFETFPAFSADGKTLYFASAAHKDLPRELKETFYNICSISFDPETGIFGNKVDTVVNLAIDRKSATLPRASYDGKYLMYNKINYGSFPMYHTDADLWLLDLNSGETRPLNEVNSAYSDGYHNWSSNSRWFVFESRRDGDLFARPYFSHIDENGNVGKPFMLPQQNPDEYYQDLFYAYNTVEFVTGKVPFNARKVEKELMQPDREEMLFERK